MYKQILVSVFLYRPFSNIGGGGGFAIFVKVKVKFGKKSYLCNECTKSYTFGITTLSISLSNFWVHLASGKIVHWENIPTYTKSHLNCKYAMDLFLKSLQEMKQKLY